MLNLAHCNQPVIPVFEKSTSQFLSFCRISRGGFLGNNAVDYCFPDIDVDDKFCLFTADVPGMD